MSLVFVRQKQKQQQQPSFTATDIATASVSSLSTLLPFVQPL